MNAIVVRQMTRGEVDVLVEWAALEGWNPGLHDADVFWAHDSDAFLAAELDGELIGGGAIAAYGRAYGFLGFFIVRPSWRGRGHGAALWRAMTRGLRARLDPGAPDGLDGVFDMQPYYAKSGFVFDHRNTRYAMDVAKGVAEPGDAAIRPLAAWPFAEIAAYDRLCFPAARDTFLALWTAPEDGRALGLLRDGRLAGYGVVRRCREGCKIGPLFADDGDAAERLFAALLPFAAGGPVYLDAPETNPAAMALVDRHRMEPGFGCARMYRHGPPAVDEARVFGVTSFEFG